jgi:hypothetical protein
MPKFVQLYWLQVIEYPYSKTLVSTSSDMDIFGPSPSTAFPFARSYCGLFKQNKTLSIRIVVHESKISVQDEVVTQEGSEVSALFINGCPRRFTLLPAPLNMKDFK